MTIQKVIVIGAVAAGTKAACRFKRLEPESSVTVIDKDELISYGGCGIPFYISGDVSTLNELRSTPYHMVRDPYFFKKVKNIDVLDKTEVIKINREKKSLIVKDAKDATKELFYDKLVIATGTSPRSLNVEGSKLKNIFNVSNLSDAKKIKEVITAGKVEKAVIVGAGFIGLEMAEALREMWDIDVSVVEIASQAMFGFVSNEMGQMVKHHMEENGVSFFFNEGCESFEGDEEGFVKKVKTNKRILDADLVITSVGVIPQTQFAKDAGIKTNPAGGIIVNEKMQTNDPDIYAGGDCAAIKNLITNEYNIVPMGSLANREGRVIGSNLAKKDEKFEGAIGSFILKFFECSLAGAGLTLEKAKKAGFDAMQIQGCQFDKAHFYPEKELLFLEIVFDKKSRQILGIQGFGSKKDSLLARINSVIPLIRRGEKLEELSNLEFTYSPPFASAMDVINAIANIASNYADGLISKISPLEFKKIWDENNDEYFLLDCRAKHDAKAHLEKYPDRWINIPQDDIKDNINKIPKDKKIVVICNTGLRAFEAQLNLKEMGLDSVYVAGGLGTCNKMGIKI